MANLDLKVERKNGEKAHTITILFSNDLGKAFILGQIKGMFEKEMPNAKITSDKTNTTVIIQTEDEEKVNGFKNAMDKISLINSGLKNKN